jgi:transposase InsO family protein
VLRVPQNLHAAAPGRVAGESQEDRAALSGRRASIAPLGAEEAHGRPPRRPAAAQRARALFAMDFVHGRLATGRRFKCLTMTDLCSKEVPVIEVDASNGGERVCRIPDRLFAGGSLPETVILDNGPEFSGTALDVWAAQMG